MSKIYGLMQISTGRYNRGYNPDLDGWTGIASQVIANWRRAEVTGKPWDGIILYRPDGYEPDTKQMRFDGSINRKRDAAGTTSSMKFGWANDAELVNAFARMEDRCHTQPLVYLGCVSAISEWNTLGMAALDAKVRESVAWLLMYREVTGRPLPCVIIDDSGPYDANSTTWDVRRCLARMGFDRIGAEVTHKGSPWIGPKTACTTLTSGQLDVASDSWYPGTAALGHEEIILISGRQDNAASAKSILKSGRSIAVNMQGVYLPKDILEVA